MKAWNKEIGQTRIFKILDFGKGTVKSETHNFSGSPNWKKPSVQIQGTKRKEGKYSKCHQIGHRKNNTICPFFQQRIETSEDDSSNENIEEHEPLNVSDETGKETEASTTEESQD